MLQVGQKLEKDMKLSHGKLIVISGLVWFAIGLYLLQLGLALLLGGVDPVNVASKEHYPLIKTLYLYFGSFENAVLALIVAALLVGYIKGRYVLGKSAKRGVARILGFPNPTNLSNIYSGKYYILLAAMVALGVSIKYLGLSNDIRGLVDAAIGSALINGAMVYFKLAIDIKSQPKNKKREYSA
jgi:hypothetical protein